MTSIDFEAAKEKFEHLCRLLDIPVPKIGPALPSDPCDFTSIEEVRLNVQASLSSDLDYYVRHNVGHYICALEGGEDTISNKAADVIAGLIDSMRRS